MSKNRRNSLTHITSIVPPDAAYHYNGSVMVWFWLVNTYKAGIIYDVKRDVYYVAYKTTWWKFRNGKLITSARD